MPKRKANQDYFKVSGRDEQGRLPSDPDVTPEELPRSRARIARGEDAPPSPNLDDLKERIELDTPGFERDKEDEKH
jgi:hypothetical protein